MIVRDLFVRLGLEEDSASFAEGFGVVELLKAGLEKVAELATEAVDFLKEQIAATAEAGDAAARMAARLGVTTDVVQKLAYVGKTANLSLEEMQQAFRTLATKGVKDIPKYILEMADSFSKSTNGAEKLRKATEALGRGGAAWIPILNKGKEAIKGLMEEAEETGYVMSEEGIESTDKYVASMGRLHGALTGLRNEVILPLLKPLATFFTWLANGVITLTRWIKGADSLNVHLKSLAITIATLAVAMGFYALATNAGAIATAVLTWNFAGAAVAAWAFIAPILVATATFLAWALAIGAVFLLIDDLVVFFENGDSLIGRALKKWIGPFKTWQEALHLVWGKVKEGLSHAFDAAISYVKGVLANFWAGIKNSAVEVWEAILAGIKKIPGVEFLMKHIAAAGAAADAGGGVTDVASAYFTGGATSPAAAAALNTSSTTNISNLTGGRSGAPQVQVHVELDGEKLDKRTRVIVSDHHDAATRDLAAAAGS
jgi:hypothetical protein